MNSRDFLKLVFNEQLLLKKIVSQKKELAKVEVQKRSLQKALMDSNKKYTQVENTLEKMIAQVETDRLAAYMTGKVK